LGETQENSVWLPNTRPGALQAQFASRANQGPVLYRPKALAKISSPDELDVVLRIVPPTSWFALLTLAGLILAVVLWGYLGQIPIITQGPGVLLARGTTHTVVSLAAGQVVEVNVARGDQVRAGTVVARLQPLEGYPQTARVDIVSTVAGEVADLNLRTGSFLNPGDKVVTLVEDSERLQAVLSLPADQGKRVHEGMEVRLSPTTVRQEQYGMLLGRVRSLTGYPITETEMTEVLGNSDLAKVILGEGGTFEAAPIMARVDLQVNTSTPSGYAWTSRMGPDYKLTSGLLCQSQTVTGTERPVELVVPWIRRLLGEPELL